MNGVQIQNYNNEPNDAHVPLLSCPSTQEASSLLIPFQTYDLPSSSVAPPESYKKDHHHHLGKPYAERHQLSAMGPRQSFVMTESRILLCAPP